MGTLEHRAILEGNRGTRTPPPPGRPSLFLRCVLFDRFVEFTGHLASLVMTSLDRKDFLWSVLELPRRGFDPPFIRHLENNTAWVEQDLSGQYPGPVIKRCYWLILGIVL